MESLISDKDAMDPEVVVGGGDKVASAGPKLWQGLPQSWALATFIVSSIAVASWNFPECLAGLTVASLIVCLRGTCGGMHQTGSGAWLLLLHQCCNLAGVVAGVRATLQYMVGHSSWLTSHMALCPRSASLAVLIFIITLHALGLERSRILRWGLLACVPITLSMIFLGELMFFSGDKVVRIFYQELPSLNKVADVAAFFSVVFSSSLTLTSSGDKLNISSFFPVKLMFVSCLAAIGFLSIALIDIRDENLGEVLLFSVLEKEQGGRAWRVLRGGLAVFSMTSLSLSLVEVVAEAQRGVVGVSGVILPPQVARDHWWTATQLSAIAIAGSTSAVLLFLPLQSLVKLSSTSYLLSQVCDIVFTVYISYQPSFVPKNYGTEGGGVSYQLLPDTALLVDRAAESESELSDDSGHSSDTDIDAAVHEYKQTVRVAKTMEEPRAAPTVRSARITILSLLAIATISFTMAGALSFGRTHVLLFSALVVVLVTYVISRQPQETEERGSHVLSPWQPCISLSLQLTLAALFLPQLWIPLVTWVSAGVFLWLLQKRRHWWNLQSRLSRHVDRVRLPRPQLSQSFQPSYHKLSTLDTVHIVR